MTAAQQKTKEGRIGAGIKENLYLMSFISLSPQVVAVISKAYAVTSQTVMTVTQSSVPIMTVGL